MQSRTSSTARGRSLSDSDRRGDVSVPTAWTTVCADRRHGDIASGKHVVDSYERREHRQTLSPREVKGLATSCRGIRQARRQDGSEPRFPQEALKSPTINSGRG